MIVRKPSLKKIPCPEIITILFLTFEDWDLANL